MVEAPIADQAKRPFTVGIGLVIWTRYCCLRMIGIRYFLHRPLVPSVPQASAWRCILHAQRERAGRDDCKCKRTRDLVGKRVTVSGDLGGPTILKKNKKTN